MDRDADFHPFSLNRVPEVCFGPGRVGTIAEDAAVVGDGGRPIVLIVDPALVELGVAARVVSTLQGAGAKVAVFSDIDGEPKQKQLEDSTEAVRANDAGLVVSLGGGSVMDVGKVAATIARTGDSPLAYAMEGKALPSASVPQICVPTTAGTGSELSSTNIFTNAAGRKAWVWGVETKPDRVILDPELTLTVPPLMTAWTGLDAFVHALESSTNANRHAANDLYAHKALGLIAGWLETAVDQPGNLAARSAMLLGSAYAGISIDNCSCAIAHNISHALSALAPVHHGLASGLGLEVTLGWQAEADHGPVAAAAAACGLERDARALAHWYTDLLNRCAIERKLPEGFTAFAAADLAAEMRAPETRPMREAAARRVGDPDIDRFAGAVMALA